MFIISFADLNIQIMNYFEDIKTECKDYMALPDSVPDISVGMTFEEIQRWQEGIRQNDHKEISLGMAEYYGVHRKIYGQLFPFDAFRMHGVAVVKDGEAYIFTAPSGYGKTTHASLWMNAFPKSAYIINGDNPVIRRKDGVFYAYGTPFGGKEGYQVNTCAPLKGVCYLQRSDDNKIERMTPEMAYGQLIREYSCWAHEHMEKAVELYGSFVENVPVYLLSCNEDVDAARVAYRGMSSERKDNEKRD